MRRQPGSEFPNDNCSLHEGAIWVCLKPTGSPRAVVRPPQAGAAALDLPPQPSPTARSTPAQHADAEPQTQRSLLVSGASAHATPNGPQLRASSTEANGLTAWVDEPDNHVDAYRLPPVAVLPAQPIFESQRAPCPPLPKLPAPHYQPFDAPSFPELPANVRSALAEFERSLDEPAATPLSAQVMVDTAAPSGAATPAPVAETQSVETPVAEARGDTHCAVVQREPTEPALETDWDSSDPFVTELAHLVSPLLHASQRSTSTDTDTVDPAAEFSPEAQLDDAPLSTELSHPESKQGFQPHTVVTSFDALTPKTPGTTSYAPTTPVAPNAAAADGAEIEVTPAESSLIEAVLESAALDAPALDDSVSEHAARDLEAVESDAMESDAAEPDSAEPDLAELDLAPLELELTPLSGEVAPPEQTLPRTAACARLQAAAHAFLCRTPSAAIAPPAKACPSLQAAAHAFLSRALAPISTDAPKPSPSVALADTGRLAASTSSDDLSPEPTPEVLTVTQIPANSQLLKAARQWFARDALSEAPAALDAEQRTAVREATSLVLVEEQAAADESNAAVDAKPAAPETATDFERFVEALVATALEQGATKAAGCLPLLLEGQSLDTRLLGDDTWSRLCRAGIVENRGAHYAPCAAFLSVASGWRTALSDPGADLGACADTTLDAWSTSLLSTLLDCPDDAKKLRRDLRRRGIAAFGLLQAA